MTDPSPAPAAPNPNPADPGSNPKPNDPEALLRKNQELIDEKRKEREARLAADARVAALEAEKRQAEEKKLQDQNEWKTIAEQREKELADAKADIAAREKRELEARKYRAFKRALGFPLDDKWYPLAPTDLVKASEHGEIDEASAKVAAEKFKIDYPEAIPNPNGGRGTGLQNDPPKGAPGSLSPEEYHKLPVSEQRRRYAEVNWKNK